MLSDPHVHARNMVVEVEHARLGKMRTLGTPIKFSTTPTAVTRGAPVLGQHTHELLREYGYSDAEIAQFATSGDVVIAEQMPDLP